MLWRNGGKTVFISCRGKKTSHSDVNETFYSAITGWEKGKEKKRNFPFPREMKWKWRLFYSFLREMIDRGWRPEDVVSCVNKKGGEERGGGLPVVLWRSNIGEGKEGKTVPPLDPRSLAVDIRASLLQQQPERITKITVFFGKMCVPWFDFSLLRGESCTLDRLTFVPRRISDYTRWAHKQRSSKTTYFGFPEKRR